MQEIKNEIVEENAVVALQPVIVDKKKGRKSKSKKAESCETDAFADFNALAELLDRTVEDLKEEFFIFHIRKLMSKISKTVVRFNVSDEKMEKILQNAKTTGIGSVVVAPVYLPTCKKQAKKLNGYSVSAILDFPFGESALASKISGIADCKNRDVDDVIVMMPSLLFEENKVKELKKQLAKFARKYKGHVGVGLNATDLNEEQIKNAMNIAKKTKIAFVTFVFGTASLEEVKSKMGVVQKYKGNKNTFVFANVERAEVLTELFRLGVDKILTPYADDIAKELFKKFKIKSLKLV